MKIPRDVSGAELARALANLGYRETRQTGSHLRMSTSLRGQHHVTIPLHKTLPVGTLHAILRQICRHFELTVEELAARLFE